MICQNCGNNVDENSMFCDKCGTKIAVVAATPQMNNVDQPASQSQPVPPVSVAPKKSGNIWVKIIVILSILICAAIGFIVFLLVTREDDSDKKNPIVPTGTEEITTEEETTTEVETTTEETSTEEESTTEEETTTGVTEVKDITLKLWVNDKMLNGASGNWISTICEEFEKEHPEWDITWDFTEVSENDAYLYVSGASVKPDVFLYSSRDLMNLVKNDMLAEIDKSAFSYLDGLESLVDTVTYDGKIYGMPYTANTYAMYYDKSVYEDVDITSLDAMMEVAPIGIPTTSSWYMQAFFLANGCSFSETKYDFGGEKAEAVVEYLLKNIKDGKIVNSGDSGVKASAIIDGSWREEEMQEYFGENYGVAVLPKIDLTHGDGQLKAMTSSIAFGVSKDSENVEAAMEFVKYMTSDTVQQSMYHETSIIPVNSVYLDAFLSEYITAQMGVLDECSIAEPVYLTADNWWTPSGQLCESIAYASIEDIKKAVEEFNSSMNNALAEGR